MVTGANVTGEVHDQLAAHSPSLESFKSPSGSGHVDQPVTSKQDVQHGSNKAADTKKPLISVLPTEGPIGIVSYTKYFSRLMVCLCFRK